MIGCAAVFFVFKILFGEGDFDSEIEKFDNIFVCANQKLLKISKNKLYLDKLCAIINAYIYIMRSLPFCG